MATPEVTHNGGHKSAWTDVLITLAEQGKNAAIYTKSSIYFLGIMDFQKSTDTHLYLRDVHVFTLILWSDITAIQADRD